MRRSLGVLLPLALVSCDRLFALDEVVHADAALDAPIDAAVCPEDYIVVLPSAPTSRYKHVGSFVPWDNAVADCALDAPGRTHLVVISSDVERIQAAEVMPANSLWIGLSDRITDGKFQWVTNEAAVVPADNATPWGAGQPSGVTQDCVRIEGPGPAATLYDDGECSAGYMYLCECDTYADDSSRY